MRKSMRGAIWRTRRWVVRRLVGRQGDGLVVEGLVGEKARGDRMVVVGTLFIGAVWVEITGSNMAECARIFVFTK